MKYGSLVVLALVVVAAMAPAQLLTQSSDNTTITALNSVACAAGGVTTENSYFRSYLIPIGGPREVVSIRFGIEAMTPATGHPMVIRLYTDNANPASPAPLASCVLIHTESFLLNAAPPGIVTIFMSTGGCPVVTGGDQLVVELNSPAVPAGNFFIGSNAAAETAPSYLKAVGCAIAEPTTTAGIGFPSMHIILDVNLAPIGSCPSVLRPGTNEDLQLYTAVGANPLTNGIGNDVKAMPYAAGSHLFTIKVVSNGNTFNYRELLLVADAFVTGFPPVGIFPGIWESGALVFIIGNDPNPFGPAVLPPGGTTVALNVPPGLVGASALIQGLVVAITPPMAAANGIFASTEAHELQVQP